jgi:hypothetical protein
MKYTFENEDFVYAFDFKVDGNFVVPDDNAYVYKVRNIDGTILTSGEGTTVPEVDDEEEKIEGDEELHPDSSSFVIPAEYNTRGEGKLFEGRIIEISFFYKGKPYTLRDSYRVTGFYYFTASTKDVRDYYGLNEGELPDADIDLTEVYLQLVQKHGQTFIDCLNTAGLGNIRANRLIVLKGVVQVFSSVRLRVNQEENDGSSKFIRYLNKIDWDALLDSALSEIEELEGNLTGEEVITYTDYNPFFLGAVRDAITGEEE